MTSTAGAKHQNETDSPNSAKLQRRPGAQGKDVAAAMQSDDSKETTGNRPVATTKSQPIEEAMRTAAERVFHVGKLFDAILKHVDMKTLLLSQKVSRTWKATITSSDKMQKKLFLKKAQLKEMMVLVPAEDESCTMMYARNSFSDPQPDTGVLNPLLFGEVDDTYVWREAGIKLNGHQGLSDCRPGDTPSWENMLLVNPPTEWLEIFGDGESFPTDGDMSLHGWIDCKNDYNLGRRPRDWMGAKLTIEGEFKSVAEQLEEDGVDESEADCDDDAEEDSDQEDSDREGSDQEDSDQE
ncbi:hypothetical protein LTR17_013054 [Elasticomyces elasticus]|nr:hypothetical protein LTR17_013054 [Elasticomyces elasticus]